MKCLLTGDRMLKFFALFCGVPNIFFFKPKGKGIFGKSAKLIVYTRKDQFSEADQKKIKAKRRRQVTV